MSLITKLKERYKWDTLTPKQKAYTLVFGSMTKGEAFMLAFLIIFILYNSWSYSHDIAAYKDAYENPCKYCVDCSQRDATGWKADIQNLSAGAKLPMINNVGGGG